VGRQFRLREVCRSAVPLAARPLLESGTEAELRRGDTSAKRNCEGGYFREAELRGGILPRSGTAGVSPIANRGAKMAKSKIRRFSPNTELDISRPRPTGCHGRP
jgi:hypothetical protein